MYEKCNIIIEVSNCTTLCRHCYLGYRPNVKLARLSFDQISQIIDDAYGLLKPPKALIEEKLTVTFFPETALAPCFPKLIKKLNRYGIWWEHSRAVSTNGISYIHNRNGEKHIKFLKSIGNTSYQLTLHGLEDFHDWFVRRKGSFKDIIRAAELFYSSGCTVNWQIFLYKKNLHQIVDMKRLIKRISSFDDANIHLTIPVYIENATEIDDLRLDSSDLTCLSSEDREKLTARSMTEGEYVTSVLDGNELEFWRNFNYPEVIIKGDLTVTRSNYAYEIIGSLRDNTLAEIIRDYQRKTPCEEMMYGQSYQGLAKEFGDPECTKLYSPYGIWIKWVEKMLVSRDLSPNRRFYV